MSLEVLERQTRCGGWELFLGLTLPLVPRTWPKSIFGRPTGTSKDEATPEIFPESGGGNSCIRNV